MLELIEPFKETLFEGNWKDLDLAAIRTGVDAILQSDDLNARSFFSDLRGAVGTIGNLRDRNLMNQTKAFIQALNEGTISSEKIKRHKEKLDRNPAFAEKELGRVLTCLDSSIDEERSMILGRFYRAYVDQQISWGQFCKLSEVSSRIFISDLCLLKRIASGEITDTKECEHYRVQRLVSAGLADQKTAAVLGGPHGWMFVGPSSLGSLFCDIGLPHDSTHA